jgi:Zn-dependent protease/CBS domain-containing protein
MGVMTPPVPPRLSVLGVPIRFHFTFLLLFVFVAFLGMEEGSSAVGHIVYLVGLVLAVFVHELAHALAARRMGIRTLEILVLPLGGVARLERQPECRQELLIAAAGPLANLAVTAVILGVRAATGTMAPLHSLVTPTDANLPERLAAASFFLAVFNLIPAFPMDGGRMLRAWLARSRDEASATKIAARVGSVLAIAMALYGLLSKDYFLIFIAFFLYLGAAQEGVASTGRSLMRGATVRQAMMTDFKVLRHSDTIREAASQLLASSQQDFPVMTGDAVGGLLTRADLLRAMAAEGPDAYVAGCMNRDYLALAPDTDLEKAAPLLAGAGNCALVMDQDHLAGLLTTENLSEFLVLRQIGQTRE